MDALSRQRTAGSVALGCARRGQLHMRARASVDVDCQLVAADDAARRMNNDVLAHRVALGIERLLHHQRSAVDTCVEHRALSDAPVADIELRKPAVLARVGIERRIVHAFHGTSVAQAGGGAWSHRNRCARADRAPNWGYRLGLQVELTGWVYRRTYW